MNSKYRLAIGDDDPDFPALLRLWLEKAGHLVTVYASPKAFLEGVRDILPTAVFLDVRFGLENGCNICRALRGDAATKHIRIIMISGICRETDDVTKGLECGADAYLCKPLDRRLVLAELNSVMRRFRTGVEPGVVRGCGVSLDPDARRVRAGRREVPLTRLEFDLLACLLRSQGQVLSTQQLLEKVFGYEPGEHIDPATVHVHISQLRKKLGKTFSARLATLVNSGYRLG